MTPSEVSFAKSNQLKIVPIWSDWPQYSYTAVGYANGQAVAHHALAGAKNLGIATGVTFYVDIEQGNVPDDQFLRGWFDTISAANFVPGYYLNPSSAGSAYCQAVGEDSTIGSTAMIWSSEPEGGPTGGQPTTKNGKPAYQPQKPNCASQTLGWQYCETNASSCNYSSPPADEDEFQSNAHFWLPSASVTVSGQELACCLVL